MDEIDRLLARVKDRACGWMPLAVYRRLYQTAASCGGGTIVEIGTYRGAATIAMALGARTAAAPFRIVTADLLRPGIGLEGTDPREKAAALREALGEFGAADAVHFVHGSAETLVAEAEPHEIRLLLLDGGGSIEEDLALLWGRLAPDAMLVIDDIDGRLTVTRRGGIAEINQKHRLSKLLVELFIEAGMLMEIERIGSTGWYRKGAVSPTPNQVRLMALPVYRSLVRARVRASEFGLPRAIARMAAARAPWIRALYRRLRSGG